MQIPLAAVYKNGSQEEEERNQWPVKGPVWQSRSTLEFLGVHWWYWRWGRSDYLWVTFLDIELTRLNIRLYAAMGETEFPGQ